MRCYYFVDNCFFLLLFSVLSSLLLSSSTYARITTASLHIFKDNKEETSSKIREGIGAPVSSKGFLRRALPRKLNSSGCSDGKHASNLRDVPQPPPSSNPESGGDGRQRHQLRLLQANKEPCDSLRIGDSSQYFGSVPLPPEMIENGGELSSSQTSSAPIIESMENQNNDFEDSLKLGDGGVSLPMLPPSEQDEETEDQDSLRIDGTVENSSPLPLISPIDNPVAASNKENQAMGQIQHTDEINLDDKRPQKEKRKRRSEDSLSRLYINLDYYNGFFGQP